MKPWHAKTKSEWSELRSQYVANLTATHGIRLRLRDRVWAVTDDGRWIALPGVTATSNPDKWWLVYMRDEFRQRGAVGAILLCASVDQPLLDFGLPANFIGEIEPHLSVGNGREQLYFNVLRRGTRFELQLKDGRSVDITRRLGDVSWLREARAAASGQEASVASAPRGAVAEARLDYGRVGDVRSGDDHRFFARYVDEGLQPLDPIDLRNEAVYLVEARLMNAAPRSRALRRIIARGGPSGLPRDLAEQHDYYAHGSRRR